MALFCCICLSRISSFLQIHDIVAKSDPVMILLRRIRQKLMKKNRFTSYILYALGEILLVVIGILIAVQFNNRNNELKLDKIEELSLISLTEDLTDDINRFTFLTNRLSERQILCDSTLRLIRSQQTLEDRLGIISIHQINNFLIEANTTTYDEMINTGRLYSMKDKDLRAQIIDYYRAVARWTKYIEGDYVHLNALMTNPRYNDYWVIQDNLWGDIPINTKKYPWLQQTHSREMKDIESLISRADDIFRSSNDKIGFLKREAERLIKNLPKSDE